MAKAKWTTSPRDIVVSTDADGTFHFSAPLLDSGVKAGDLTFAISADRVLTVVWVNAAGDAGLQGFTAWSKES